MRLKSSAFLGLIFLVVCIIKCQNVAAYKTEIEITPAPPEDETTKKSGGFFSGIKSFFRGSSDKTTTTPAPITPKQHSGPAVHTNGPNLNSNSNNNNNNRPSPLLITNAPLMPLGPRPDTPSSSPFAGNQQQPPQWPQPGQSNLPQTGATSTATSSGHQQHPINPNTFHTGGQIGGFGSGNTQNQRYPSPAGGNQAPNLPSGFTPRRPDKAQPSGFDLSYGGANAGGYRPQNGGHAGAGLVPFTSSTTTTTTTPRSAFAQQPNPQSQPKPSMDIDLRFGTSTTSTTTHRPQQGKDEYPPLPPPRKSSLGGKEDFPALPTPKTPTPASPLRPSSPSAWNSPLPTSSTPATPGSPRSPGFGQSHGTGGVSFVPSGATTTTVRPGVTSDGNSKATDDEIRQLTEALYNKEVNSQINSITVNLQGKTRSIDSSDEAPKPLLEINESVFQSPTIAKMRVLFNNYESDTLVNEHVSPMERIEENEFVDAVMATSVMRHAMSFLQSKGLVSPDPKTHRDLIKELWFTQYSRGQGKVGSSGFEHVFANEVKNGTIIGLHNWVYFYDEEKAGHLDYKGYMNTLDMGTKGKVVKARFTHNGLNKPVNTLFIGTSPELELALYTVCFELRADRNCPVSLGNSRFGIVTYSWRYRGKNLIGSAYPEI